MTPDTKKPPEGGSIIDRVECVIGYVCYWTFAILYVSLMTLIGIALTAIAAVIFAPASLVIGYLSLIVMFAAWQQMLRLRQEFRAPSEPA